MSGDSIETPGLPAGWRMKLGIAIFVLSILLPIAGIPLVSALGLSTTSTASISGALLIAAEVLGLAAIAVMGKSGFAQLKNRLLGFLRRHGPPSRVSRGRYITGLVMFTVPLLFGWLSIYIADLLPGFSDNPLPYAIAGDLLFLASLFVLGGDFWDKLQALFVHDARVITTRGAD
jgi:hypothetical protein